MGDYKLGNVTEFRYLGHTIYSYPKGNTYTDLHISSALCKFHEMSQVLKDGHINLLTRLKLLEACVISRLVYASQSWWPNEAELKKLESCWYG